MVDAITYLLGGGFLALGAASPAARKLVAHPWALAATSLALAELLVPGVVHMVWPNLDRQWTELAGIGSAIPYFWIWKRSDSPMRHAQWYSVRVVR